MHIVTGVAGFISSNRIRSLNGRGVTDTLAVDNLLHGDKFANLKDCEIADFIDAAEFRESLRRDCVPDAVSVVFRQGACADTTEPDGRYMMDNNYTFSKELLH
jgi:ADP-L-glycero-D-manno-heptose 6-epimerase